MIGSARCMADWSCTMSGMAVGCDDGVDAEDQHQRASPAAHPEMTDEILEPFGGTANPEQHGRCAEVEGSQEQCTVQASVACTMLHGSRPL